MDTLISILKNFWNRFKTHIIYVLIILILCSFLTTSINQCSSVKNEYENNIEALNDTIKYYQDKNGNLVAKKLAFESDIKTLKTLNKQLYEEIENLKMKNKVSSIVYVNGEIENPPKDTVYIVDNNTLSKGFTRDFNFNDEYRVLEGNIKYKNDSLGIFINKDIINFDYTVGIDEKNNIYVKSTNPYVKYNEISGFRISQPKKTHWSFGPAIGLGYDPFQNKLSFSLGVSLNYSLFKF